VSYLSILNKISDRFLLNDIVILLKILSENLFLFNADSGVYSQALKNYSNEGLPSFTNLRTFSWVSTSIRTAMDFDVLSLGSSISLYDYTMNLIRS
jgi:hypothetical protein